MSERAVNKVVYGGNVLIDLTSTTATASTITSGYGAYGADGSWVSGTAVAAGEGGTTYQDSQNYVVLDDSPGETNISIGSLSVTSNGTYSAASGTAYTPVTVNVPDPLLEECNVTYIGTKDYTIGSPVYRYEQSDITNIAPVDDGLDNIEYHVYLPDFSFQFNSYELVLDAYFSGNLGTVSMNTVTFDHFRTEYEQYGYHYEYADTSGFVDYITLGWDEELDQCILIIHTTLSSEYTLSTAPKLNVNYVKMADVIDWWVGDIIEFPPFSREFWLDDEWDTIFEIGQSYYLRGVIIDESGENWLFKDEIRSSVVTMTGSTLTIPFVYNGTTYNVIADGEQEEISTSFVNGNDGFEIAIFKVIDVNEYPIGYSSVFVKGEPNIQPSNIRSGVWMFGTLGTYSGDPPTGTLSISSNGTYDVKSYAYASVNVAGGNTAMEDALVGDRSTITSYVNSRVTAIASSAFTGCSNLTTVSFASVTTINAYAFTACSKLSSIYFPKVSAIGSYAFSSCTSISTIDLPLIQVIDNAAFMKCTALASFSFSNLTSISMSGFNNCTKLSTATATKLTYIGQGAFSSCISLATVDFPVLSSLGTGYGFYACSKLRSVSFISVTSIPTYTFYNCYTLSSVYFPLVTHLGSNAFGYCYSLITADFPKVSMVGSYAFRMCNRLTTLTLGSATTIYSSAFNGCMKLLSLYLYGSSVCSLVNVNAFVSTPISNYTTSTGGVYGSIYVPSSLYNAYKSATNWVTFSSRFVSV